MCDNDIKHCQGGDEAAGSEVPDLAAIKARVREMEEEAEKLKQMQTEVDKQMSMGSPPGLSKLNYLYLSAFACSTNPPHHCSLYINSKFT